MSHISVNTCKKYCDTLAVNANLERKFREFFHDKKLFMSLKVTVGVGIHYTRICKYSRRCDEYRRDNEDIKLVFSVNTA